jgi:hypothetical protein
MTASIGLAGVHNKLQAATRLRLGQEIKSCATNLVLDRAEKPLLNKEHSLTFGNIILVCM